MLCSSSTRAEGGGLQKGSKSSLTDQAEKILMRGRLNEFDRMGARGGGVAITRYVSRFSYRIGC